MHAEDMPIQGGKTQAQALTGEALPDVLLHFWPLDVSASSCLVHNGHWSVSRLGSTWLFLRCIEVLRHALAITSSSSVSMIAAKDFPDISTPLIDFTTMPLLSLAAKAWPWGSPG